MEPRKDDARSAAQGSVRGSSSSACTNYPVPEYPVAGTAKPVLNYSIQTGEEFSLEFMRAIPKKYPVPGMPHNQNVTSGAAHRDSRIGLAAHRTGAETRFDASIFLTSDTHQTDVVERKPFSENENRRRHMSGTSFPRVPSGGGSSQGLSRGYASSEASETSRTIKILCSFGGKILPRPSDGKLRYVGGETHIIRISRNISWQELKQKTTAICSQPHVIKYQLPGEDLDALISVSNDEDLRNMMEECGLLDNGDGSQKLRIFLVSSIEYDDMSFSLGSMDSDSGIQYVAAINGMDGMAGNSSSGPGLVNASINEFDQFINLNIDSRPTNSSRDGSNLHAVSASTFMPQEMLSKPMPSAVSGDNSANLHSYYSHGMQNLQGNYANPATNEGFYDIEGQISIPLSTPSDYRYTSQYAPFSGTASQRSLDQQAYQDAEKATSTMDEKRISGVAPTASVQEGVASSLQPSDSARSLETCTAPRARSTTQGSDISEDDRHSGGAFASGCSDFQIDNPTTMKNAEGFQVDNPFTNMREMMPSHPDFEEQKTEEARAVGPVMDASFKDTDFEYLQIIKNEDLEELRELGSGTFGTVYHGKWRGSDVAIKRIKKSCFTGRSSELERLAHEFWREAEILSKLHHPNVVAFYGVVKDGPGGTLATVTEFMVNGSLRHVLQRKDKYLDRRKRLIIAMDAAFGLEYLHSKNIVHFDLKCDNLLVNLKDQSRPICKVGDFGLSKIKRNTLVSGGVRGTLPWMAPELLNGSSNKVSEKVDVFSFGIVLWEILTGEEPYANMHYGAIIGGIVNNTLRPPVPASCDPEWRRLMEQCWAPDPAQRPAFTEIAGRLRAMSVAANQAKATK
ncbi:unnamed protein product [Urochloa humidicola]